MMSSYSPEEEKGLDFIEERLVAGGIPFRRMMKMYAEFLRDSIMAGQFDRSVSLAQLEIVAENLQSAIGVLGTSDSDKLRMPSRLALWSLSDRYEKENSTLSALSRCAVCCFYEESGWDHDGSESLTPIPLYLFLLKRIDPGMGMEFLRYASKYLLKCH